MSGTNVKIWTAGELQQEVQCELEEAQAAITALGATAPLEQLIQKVLSIRRDKAQARALVARKVADDFAAKAAVKPVAFEEESDSSTSLPRP